MVRTWIAITALALAALGALAGTASAGEFHVYGCRTPGGAVAPADGWNGTKVGTFVHAENTCADPDGGLVAALGDQAARTANTDSATWAFSPPTSSRIVNAVLWRAGDADGGAAVNAFYEFWLAGPLDANTPEDAFDQCVGG
ncbi:MAG TPA: hypothetical protein VFW29_12195, partial [Solirubrobacteraceae bacterium]|nr:hypothetical protein [Solirubrobacteraceae bacterium]